MSHIEDWQFDYASENDMYVTAYSVEELENYLQESYLGDKICLYCVLFHKNTEKKVTVFGANNRFVVECWTNKAYVFQRKDEANSVQSLIYNYPNLGENLEVLSSEIMSLKEVVDIVEHFYKQIKPHPDFKIIQKSYIYS